MASDVLFIRESRVEMFPKIIGTNSPINEVDLLTFVGRTSFNVELTSPGTPNKASISLYNLSQQTRNFLEDDNILIRLKAGYEDNIGTIFLGDLNNNGVKTDRSGADIITVLECSDSEKILNRVHIELGLAPGVTNVQLFQAAADKLGLVAGIQKGIKTITYLQGYPHSGLVRTLLDDLTKQLDLEWNVQAGVLRILPKDETDNQDAVLITKETGLIGFPTKTKKRIEARSLLNNKIIPGNAVKIVSSQFLGDTFPLSQSLIDNGVILKAQKVTHEGDNNDGPWETKIEGTIPNV